MGCIILLVTYGKKVYRLGVETHGADHVKITGKIKIDVCGDAYLLKVSCHLYHFNYYSFCH